MLLRQQVTIWLKMATVYLRLPYDCCSSGIHSASVNTALSYDNKLSSVIAGGQSSHALERLVVLAFPIDLLPVPTVLPVLVAILVNYHRVLATAAHFDSLGVLTNQVALQVWTRQGYVW